MGSFSWCLIDTRRELVKGQPFKVLVPEVYGGGSFITNYEDYGEFFFDGKRYDLLEILAAWNGADIEMDKHGLVPNNENTRKNRSIGISMGCYDEEMAELEYPLRLVSIMDEKTYECYDGMLSIGAPSQGWDAKKIYKPQLFYAAYYNKDDRSDTT